MTRTARLPRLSASDRCDRCVAQAYVRVELLAGSDLLFCAHHARQHEDTLRKVAAAIYDESDRLIEVRAAATTLVHPSRRALA